MDPYLNKELKKCVQSLQVKQGKTKDGTPYNYVSLTLINGFEKRIFVQSAEQFAFTNAFDLLDINKTIDEEF